MTMDDSNKPLMAGKEAYEQKKAERDRAKNEQLKPLRREKSLRRAGGILAWILVAVLGIYGVMQLMRGAAPEAPDRSVAIPEQEPTHVPIGSPVPPYSSDPPTSGPHYGETARTGFRTEDIADGHLIHNLEHGDIWISYNPRVDATIVERLKKFAAAKVVVTSRNANEFDISLAAWGRLDSFNIEDGVLDETRVSDFIKRYINKGPERITGPVPGGV